MLYIYEYVMMLICINIAPFTFYDLYSTLYISSTLVAAWRCLQFPAETCRNIETSVQLVGNALTCSYAYSIVIVSIVYRVHTTNNIKSVPSKCALSVVSIAFSHKRLGNMDGIGSCQVYTCLLEAYMFYLSCISHIIDVLRTRKCHVLLVDFFCYSEQHTTFRKLDVLRSQVKRMEGTCPLWPSGTL
jgi:hypothetical protein